MGLANQEASSEDEMIRRTVLTALVLLLMASSQASAQEWARKMFETTTHEFGSVPRGSKAQFRFVLENKYKEEVHIVGVRSSCGCTTPQIETQTLKTYEKGAIIATYNTNSFTGAKSATVTVTFDKPYYAEVQLNVSGFIRTDVVLTPGGVEFGTVDSGVALKKTIQITHTGDSSWRITAIKSPNAHLTAEAFEPEEARSRQNGVVQYNLTVKLDDKTPVGYVKDTLIVETSERSGGTFAVEVEGRVVPELSVSPASLFLGVLKPGEVVTKSVVVKGKKPFKIVGMECKDGKDCFQFKLPEESKPLHVIPVTFTAGETPGKVTGKIAITTDRSADVMEFVAYAQVAGPIKSEEVQSESKTEIKLEPKVEGNVIKELPKTPGTAKVEKPVIRKVE